jgi:hypothetical protein
VGWQAPAFLHSSFWRIVKTWTHYSEGWGQ